MKPAELNDFGMQSVFEVAGEVCLSQSYCRRNILCLGSTFDAKKLAGKASYGEYWKIFQESSLPANVFWNMYVNAESVYPTSCFSLLKTRTMACL